MQSSYVVAFDVACPPRSRAPNPELPIYYRYQHEHIATNHYIILPKAGISVWANQKEKTSLGPVMSSLGVSPLKKEVGPSCFIMLDTILKPLSGFSKFLFWMRVLMTSRGAETSSEALAPAIEATKFCDHDAEL
jgi:hypothetical protein